MSDLHNLYQELILDHGRKPRNFSILPDANYQQQGFNPLCGDKVTIYIKAHDAVIEKISFEGQGCAISQASASLLTQAVQGKTTQEAQVIFSDFQRMLTENNYAGNAQLLGKLIALSGVKAFPMRVKCATLAWHTLQAALTPSITSA